MRWNILVMVLSDVQFSGQTVRESFYPDLGQNVHTTNESAIRFLQQQLDDKGEKIDRIYAFATQTVLGKLKCTTGKNSQNDEKAPYYFHGKEISHLSYIQKQVEDILPADCWQIVKDQHLDGENESLPMNRTLFYTLEIANRIQQDVLRIRSTDPDAEIILHADCTGGPRHAIMMLLDILRLLQYNDVKIGGLFYSNWNRETKQGTVETVNDVYDFYNLIAGAEEFVNFGSVKDMQAYFRNRNVSKELHNLLEDMAEFSDEIKLCRRWRFVDAVENLRQTVERFEAKWEGKETSFAQDALMNDDVRLNDRLMYQLLPQIHKDYGPLLQENGSTSLTLIHWCLNQNLLQQALTLYTEGIPDLLFERGLLVMNRNPEVRKRLQTAYKVGGGELTEGFYFLNHFGYEARQAKKEHDQNVSLEVTKQTRALKALFCEMIRQHATREDAEAAFRRLDAQSDAVHIHSIHALGKIFLWLAGLQKENERIDQPGAYRVLQQTVLKMYWQTQNKAGKGGRPSDWDGLSVQKKCKRIMGFLKGNITEQQVANLAGGIGERGSFNVRWRLFENGDFIIRTDPQKLYNFIDGYAVIKNERNHTNHAKGQQGVFDTAESLMHFMRENLRQLDAMKTDCSEE